MQFLRSNNCMNQEAELFFTGGNGHASEGNWKTEEGIWGCHGDGERQTEGETDKGSNKYTKGI